MNSGSWQPHEDAILNAFRTLQMPFDKIVRYLPGRSTDAAKKRYDRMKGAVVCTAPYEQNSANDAWRRQSAAHGSKKLLRRQIEAGQVFGVTMTIWQARHGVAS